MAAPLTETVIQRIRDQITSGSLGPGSRLPPEAELAAELGASRNTVREAVRALVTARVLDVRRGDGTFVTSLRPDLLLGGIGAAMDLIQEGFSLELIGVRRILEPAATALAATRMDHTRADALAACIERMRESGSEAERILHDAEFHRLVAEASGNATLASMLNAVSGRTIRARAWRGVLDEDARSRTLAQHDDILRALRARDPTRAEAAALVHVATTESWFRDGLGDRRDTDGETAEPGPAPDDPAAAPDDPATPGR
jgi:GntR family transcriptional regulator, transcriptional repressor for pyruvate dehydrogenase complex